MVTARRACLLLPLVVTVALSGCGSASPSSSPSAARAGRSAHVTPPQTLVNVLSAVSQTRSCLKRHGVASTGQPGFPIQTKNANAAEGALGSGRLGHGVLIVFYANPGAAERLQHQVLAQKPSLRGHVRLAGSRAVVTVGAPARLAAAVRACVNS
jgi:hypothetical protein